jgi:transcriptional regulator with XRE-family HTH domain
MSSRRRPAFVYVDRTAFHLERRTAGLSQPEAARYLGVTVRTIRNWENGSHRIPYPAFRLLRMKAGGIVQVPGWDGWRFGRDGALFSPEGRSFQPWELQQLRLVFSMAEHFRQHQAGRREAADALAPQPPRLRVVGSGS